MRPWIFLGSLGLCVPAGGTPLSFSSGPAQVAVIELYTSEGCSSCPPAERWLGQLRDDARLWKEFVPVAFHVRYWDYIGWKDRFASKAFTERQHAIARAWRSEQVYTPCFVRNGEEWRSRDLSTRGTKITGELAAAQSDDGSLTVTFRPASELADATFDVFVALLGGGITSDVRAGENSGRKLAHEFVALSLNSAALVPAGNESLRAEVKMPAGGDATIHRRALAIWVTRHGELTPLQATGGWLD
jgi:hypothetical protein